MFTLWPMSEPIPLSFPEGRLGGLRLHFYGAFYVQLAIENRNAGSEKLDVAAGEENTNSCGII